jgi:hypothetical protein
MNTPVDKIRSSVFKILLFTLLMQSFTPEPWATVWEYIMILHVWIYGYLVFKVPY